MKADDRQELLHSSCILLNNNDLSFSFEAGRHRQTGSSIFGTRHEDFFILFQKGQVQGGSPCIAEFHLRRFGSSAGRSFGICPGYRGRKYREGSKTMKSVSDTGPGNARRHSAAGWPAILQAVILLPEMGLAVYLEFPSRTRSVPIRTNRENPFRCDDRDSILQRRAPCPSRSFI